MAEPLRERLKVLAGSITKSAYESVDALLTLGFEPSSIEVVRVEGTLLPQVVLCFDKGLQLRIWPDGKVQVSL